MCDIPNTYSIRNLAEVGGKNTLFIKADPGTPGLNYFKSGQIYEVGRLTLNDNESIYTVTIENFQIDGQKNQQF